jgi:hypothetical protein
MGTFVAIALASLALIGTCFVGFFRSYHSEKGKNLATKEDIAELTQKAKEIEAKIEDRMWDRQRQWELKRDVVFDVIRAIGRFGASMDKLISMHLSGRVDDVTPEQIEEDKRNSRAEFLKYATEFDDKRFVVALMCGLEFNEEIKYASKQMRGIALELRFGLTWEQFRDMQARGFHRYNEQINLVMRLARRELGIAETDDQFTLPPTALDEFVPRNQWRSSPIPHVRAIPQSSESSAAPTPDQK